MRCEIEVELSSELLGKWEPVAYRRAKRGEFFASENSGAVLQSDFDYEVTRMLIVCPVWQWPAWLKAEWIAMDSDGRWFAYKREPDTVGGEWRSGEFASFLRGDLVDFTPPPCTDWTQSKRRNPNAKDAT